MDVEIVEKALQGDDFEALRSLGHTMKGSGWTPRLRPPAFPVRSP